MTSPGNSRAWRESCSCSGAMIRDWVRAMLLATLAAVAASCADGGQTLREVRIESPDALALSLRELPAESLRSLGLPYGLTVVKAGSAAERAGLRAGDVIYAVNRRKLRSVEDFTRSVAERPGASLELMVRRGRSDFYVPVEIGGPASPAAKDRLLRT